MENETNIKPKSESNSTKSENQPIRSIKTSFVNLCAAGLGVSFFLPWASIFGNSISGFDLQKAGDEQRLLWAIPIFCAITILAGVIERSQQIIAQLTGVLPYVVGVYWYIKLKDDFFHVLAFGAWLSLIFGAALLILPRSQK